ncbi:MAG: L,D-transpeptidase family protein, partial [Rhizobiales bacterium]|nr:L,D-transpeptidase family protein [Hyphomicrobiales bacterium]
MNDYLGSRPMSFDSSVHTKRELVKAGLATLLFGAVMLLPAAAEAQSFNRTFNFGTHVYKTAPSKSERVTNKNAMPILGAHSVQAMYDALSRYEILVSRGGWPMLKPGKTMVIGSKSNNVVRLRQRLAAQGILSPGVATNSKKFDEPLAQAVRTFQSRHGLAVTGKVDNQTIAVLNVPANLRLRQLRENLPRVLEYSKNLGGRYVVVNIPAAQLESVDYDRVFSRHNVVVGKPARPSPVLSSQINKLNFNPYWHAPVSIVAKDILPKVRKNVGWLDTMRIKVFDGGYEGPEVDPRSINWNSVAPDRYHFRQEPGGENAMASVKINFPNKYAVYLHDTPTKQLFDRSARFFSSGCVRVDKVHILTEWLLRGQPGWDGQAIQNVAGSEQPTDVDIRNPAQLRMVYLTAWAQPDGAVHFRPDIYNLDGTGFISGQPR